MKNLLTIVVLYILLTISQAWSLPPCEGNVWNNCYGTWTYDDGQKYVGDWKDDKRHGQGTYTYVDGAKYVGEHKDDKFHGQGTYTWADGTKYVGEYKDSEFHGQGTYTFPNGDEYVGEYKDGKRNGQGTDTWADGEYVGDWKDDKKHGQGTYTFADGKVWEGQWSNDEWVSGKEYAAGEYNSSSQVSSLPPCEGEERSCEGSLTSPYGTIYTGVFKDGIFEGKSEKDIKYVGEYKDGKMHGQGTQSWADGAKYVGEYKDGKVHGQGTITWVDGGNYVGEWKDDNRHGQGTEIWANGDKYVGELEYNNKNGYGVLTYNDGSAEVGIWAMDNCKSPDCKKYAAGEDIEKAKKAGKEKAEKARIEEAEKERGIAIINKSKEIEQDNDNIRIALDALNYTFYGSKKDRYIIVLDAKNCIFEETASSSIFYLNNVIVDTIKFYNEATYNESSEVWEDKIKITFSGDELVFSSAYSEYSEYKGAVSDRAEVERVQKAWGVIYSKACEGASAGEF